MFAAPPVIQTEIFARVPDSLRAHSPRQQSGIERDSFLEGPSFDRDGNLYVVNIPYGQVFRVSPQGEFTVVATYDGEPNGLKIHRDGRIFIADHKQGLMLLDARNGKVEPFLDRPRRERFKGLNDLHFAKNGDLYFTDQGESGLHDPTGRLWRLRRDGRLQLLLDNVPSPNGLVLTPNEDILYLAVTRGNAVWRVPLNPDGSIGRVGIFIQLSGGTGPDGMAMDSEGNLAVCHVGMGSVWLFSRFGRPLFELPSITGHLTTNAAYGGADGKTLFITESETGTILRARLETAGLTLFSHL
ncbi:MAG: SMP-30/gluconolactonase/LRE family protein [Alphaproteobacteria bacterium]|nr:SMP-30/gluconolactonase/LRE family protein [Alphaproteobacteria bacterium]